MLPLVILRPEPGWSATAASARVLGMEVRGQPLFGVEPVKWAVPRGPFDAILAGSANVFRHGGGLLEGLRDLPVHCVGEATAQAARAAGFAVASVGNRDLQAAADRLPPGLSLLRLCGEQRAALGLPEAAAVTDLVVYRTRPLPLESEALPALAVAALHSAAAASRFAGEVDRLARDRGGFVLCANSARTAGAAGTGWRAVAVADDPRDSALLAMARALCQEPGRRHKAAAGTRNG